MKKRVIFCLVWLALAGCLYFFENNTGSRIVLFSTLLFLLIPEVRRRVLMPDNRNARESLFEQSAKSLSSEEEEEPGDVRNYQPGDPVNRIHWKLSSKRDDLLVREQAAGISVEESEKPAVIRQHVPADMHRNISVVWLCLAAGFAALVMLFVLPSANLGTKALINRLFAASEAVNAYAYEYFPVTEDQPVILAVFLLFMIALSVLGILIFSESRFPAFLCMAGCILFQVYFGLAFPWWINTALFYLFVLRVLQKPVIKRAITAAAGVVLAVSFIVLLFFPGTNTAVEDLSERVRDWFSEAAMQMTGTVQELQPGENETRHIHSQSLISGEGEAGIEKEYRLVTVEEEQISKPHWIDYLKIILLLLLSMLLVVLPFFPFLLLNARRKRIMKIRQSFQSENVSEAIKTIFQHVISWLEMTGNGAGNLPYSEWVENVSEAMTPEYGCQFQSCTKLFEEAAYSDHVMQETQRRQTLNLLDETERILLPRAGWKQKLRLKKEYIWI